MTTKPRDYDHEDEPTEPTPAPKPAEKAGPEQVSCQCGWTGTKEEAERHFYNAPSGHQKT
jgi:hypothetical protein